MVITQKWKTEHQDKDDDDGGAKKNTHTYRRNGKLDFVGFGEICFLYVCMCFSTLVSVSLCLSMCGNISEH